MDIFTHNSGRLVEELGGNPFGRFNIVIQLKSSSNEVVQNVEIPVSGTTYSETLFNNLTAVARGELEVVDSEDNEDNEDDGAGHG